MFKYSESASARIGNFIKCKIFRAITRNSLPVYMRGGDSISINPMVSGSYEKHLVEFIRHSAKTHGDFFIDVGANIGMISCQAAAGFKLVHMVEPNPVVVHILRANAALSLNNRYYIHEYGLAAKDGVSDLLIPKGNFGGAFIAEGNSYPTEWLVETSNHLKAKITVRSAREFFTKIFDTCGDKGVIKLDVEGYEETLIAAVTETLPADKKAIVCFENWNRDIDTNLFRAGNLYRFTGELMEKMSLPRRILFRLRHGWNYSLVPARDNLVGNLVFVLDRAAA